MSLDKYLDQKRAEFREKFGDIDFDDVLPIAQALGKGSFTGAMLALLRAVGEAKADEHMTTQMLQAIRQQRAERPETVTWAATEDRSRAAARWKELKYSLDIS